MTTTVLAPLTARDALALAAIVNAASRQDKVSYIRPDDIYGTVLDGHARGFFADAEGTRGLSHTADIREGFLRITLRSGFEGFYPVTDLMVAEKSGQFGAYDWS